MQVVMNAHQNDFCLICNIGLQLHELSPVFWVCMHHITK